MRGSFSFEMRERGRDEESSLHEIWSPISLLQLGCQDLWPHHLPWTTTKNNRKLRQKYSRELFSARSGDFFISAYRQIFICSQHTNTIIATIRNNFQMCSASSLGDPLIFEYISWVWLWHYSGEVSSQEYPISLKNTTLQQKNVNVMHFMNLIKNYDGCL